MRFINTTMHVFAPGVKRYHSEDHTYMILKEPRRDWRVTGPGVAAGSTAKSKLDAENIVRRAAGVDVKPKAQTIAEQLTDRLRGMDLGLSDRAMCVRQRHGDGLAWTWFVDDPDNFRLSIGSDETMRDTLKAETIEVTAPNSHGHRDVIITKGTGRLGMIG